MDVLIHLAGTISQAGYWQTGRTVESLGLAGMSIREIAQAITRG